MFSKFIERPVLSIVISIIITLLGLLSLVRLPMAQFPSIAPPEVNVTIEYTGANAETVVKAALIKIERAINGVQGMKYMSSDAGNDGVGVVQVIFDLGINPDAAAVNVQNRVASAMGELPEEVIRNGVKIAKEENAMLLYLNIFSSDSTAEEKFIYNFTTINILPELKRINGIGYAQMLGAKEYAMRIWLKPDKLVAYNLSAEDVVEALQKQNVEAAPGKVGENSDKTSEDLQYVVRYSGKYQTKEQYENIAIRSNQDGEILRIRDIADVEFGTIYFDVEARLNGKPAAAIMLKQLPGSNASQVIEEVKKRMATIKQKTFLKGMDYEISYDVSRFLDASVHEVVKTLIEAFILVALVVFLFLQDWRSTLIPTLTVPVSLIGTFFFMNLLGYSLNLITLFALVLAIGIVIDNAIVVVEAVHTKLAPGRLTVLEATQMAVQEISGAILAITLVMAAVFIPTAFMEGPVGVFYKQFSITMAVSIVLSGVSALTLTPALCAIILKPHVHQELHGPMSGFFNRFNSAYEKLAGAYLKVLTLFINRRLVTFGVLLAFLFGTGFLSRIVPSGFIPNEDQGSFYVSITTPAGATLERTKKVVNQIAARCQEMDAVLSVSSLAGTNILSDGTGATYGTCLVNLKPWADRNEKVEEVMEELENRIQSIKDARIEIFPPPAVPGYGNASGFELRLLDKTGKDDPQNMQKVVNQFMKDLSDRPEIANVFTIFDASFPQYMVQIDEDKAAQKKVSVQSTMATLQTMLGSEYASNFVKFGQMYKVMVQALPKFRAKPADILNLYVKNEDGELVPVSAFASLERMYGVDQVTRYNMYPSAEMNGEAEPGFSSGQALNAILETAETQLPQGFDIDWAGISRDEVSTGNQALYIFLICLLFVYLLLAAQYESFVLPIPVLLFLPTGVFGTLFFLWLFGLESNIYAQIALVMLIGQLGKNGILIVEFAIQRTKEGKDRWSAIREASLSRLRPILMTSFAFIAGLVPLMFATGAGAIGNQTLGSATAGGMLIGTIFGLLLVPGLYVVFASRNRADQEKNGHGRLSDSLKMVGLIVLLLPLAQACKVPNTQVSVRSQGPVPSFPTQGIETGNLPTWRAFFQDSQLVSLIDTAFGRNPDWLAMYAQLEMAQAGVLQATGARLPFAGVGGSAGIRRFGLFTMDGAGNASTDITPGKVVPEHLPDYFGGIQAAWEVDLWGKLKNQREAARMRFLATQEGKNLLATRLVSEIALAWYERQGLLAELEVVRQNLEIQQNALNIVQLQKEAALASALPVKQFEAQLANSRSLQNELTQQLVEVENQLRFLMGKWENSFAIPLKPLEGPLELPLKIPKSRDWLSRRPDIRQLENQVAASHFDLEAARLEFYPSLNVLASLGLQAFRPDYLFKGNSTAYALGGGLFGPLINRSAIKARFQSARAAQIDVLYQYQKTVLNGFLEVSNLLQRSENLRRFITNKEAEVSALESSVDIATQLYKTANSTYLEVLITQQNVLKANVELIRARKNWYQNQVNLYRALGGGWE
jgi:HAE1 family hydrophobic/amphiphilic exporter-1